MNVIQYSLQKNRFILLPLFKLIDLKDYTKSGKYILYFHCLVSKNGLSFQVPQGFPSHFKGN